MNYWFISDTHFGHSNIIKYCNRPFKDIREMNKVLVTNWNQRIKKGDVIFHLGDFCFKKSAEAPKGIFKYEDYEKVLNGKIIVIRGNHDNNNSTKTCIQSMIIKLGGQLLYLVHNPHYANKHYRINLVGHVHEKWKIKQLSPECIAVNVGVDVWGFKPISINEIFQRIARWEKGHRKNI